MEHVTHAMKLNPEPFEQIKSGRKTIELRLWDEKRQLLNVGDFLIFTNTSTGETLTCKVIKLHQFSSFDALYQALPLLQCGYSEETLPAARAADMDQYYSPDEQAKFGVVGIELTLVT